MPRQLLTEFELIVLLAILRLDEDVYGVLIAGEIERTARRRVLLGTVYAALERLERKGMISSRMGAPTAERGGRAKRFYRATPGGIRAVKEAQRALVALWTDVPRL